MIAIEYMDMMSRMMMTVSATHPRFFTISVMVKALFMSSVPPFAASWKRKAKKARALLPSTLSRIVTAEILQRFSVVMANGASAQEGAFSPRAPLGDLHSPAARLRRGGKAPRPPYCSTKLYVMTPETFTGCPESSVGENLALRAAETAACCKSGWPETAEAETTRPDSSTRICTVTVPEARAAFAMGG